MSVTVRYEATILNEMIRRAPGATNEAVGKIAAQAAGHAKDFAPYDTGALQNSIEAENISPGLWEVHDGVEYGIYQEFGTHKMAAHPFIAPAIEMVWNELLDPATWKAVLGE